jgi:hypothetical protein
MPSPLSLNLPANKLPLVERAVVKQEPATLNDQIFSPSREEYVTAPETRSKPFESNITHRGLLRLSGRLSTCTHCGRECRAHVASSLVGSHRRRSRRTCRHCRQPPSRRLAVSPNRRTDTPRIPHHACRRRLRRGRHNGRGNLVCQYARQQRLGQAGGSVLGDHARRQEQVSERQHPMTQHDPGERDRPRSAD